MEVLFNCHMKINTQMNNNWIQSAVERSKMNILFIYTCTNFAQILTFCLYIKMATYKHTEQNATKLKKYCPMTSVQFPICPSKITFLICPK
jgi:hypothetical protein